MPHPKQSEHAVEAISWGQWWRGGGRKESWITQLRVRGYHLLIKAESPVALVSVPSGKGRGWGRRGARQGGNLPGLSSIKKKTRGGEKNNELRPPRREGE